MASLDTSIANTALPTIAADVNASPANSVWVVNAYQLALVVSLLPFASLGEIVGYRRVYIWGLVVFTLASLLCALSWSLPTLTAARIIQGFGASGIMSVNTALIRFIYPAKSLGRGVGNNALVVAVSTAIGPTIAAAILSVGTWQWLFAVNVPLGIVALALAASRPARHHPSAIPLRHLQCRAQCRHLRLADLRHRRGRPQRQHRHHRRDPGRGASQPRLR